MLVAGLSRGLSMQDMEYMTLGAWIDYIIEWNNIHRDPSNKEESDRMATQSDFDAF